MPQCCVPRCKNRSECNHNDVNDVKISFYRFPCDEKERSKWLQLIGHENFIPNGNSRICSWHFPDGKTAGPTRFSYPEPKRVRLCPSKKPSTAEKGQQTDAPFLSVAALEIENQMLREENRRLRKCLEKQKQIFSLTQISDSPAKVQYYTGLPDSAAIMFLERRLSESELQYHSDWMVQSIPLVDQLLLTLMKLKLNCGHVDLATRFNISTATVTNIFITVICALYEIFNKENNCPSKNLTLLDIPPFPSEDIGHHRQISKDKIQNECSLQRLKAYRILEHVPYQFRKNIDKIHRVCVCLSKLETTNF